MSHTPTPPYTLAIQPPSLTPPSVPLSPPPTLLLSTNHTSPSPTANNLLAIASLVLVRPDAPTEVNSTSDASHDFIGSYDEVLGGVLAVPATPLRDGSGVVFVFRNLCIERIGQWRVKITVLRMNDDANGLENGIGRAEAEADGAIVRVEAVSNVVRVEENAEQSEELSVADQELLDSLSE